MILFFVGTEEGTGDELAASSTSRRVVGKVIVAAVKLVCTLLGEDAVCRGQRLIAVMTREAARVKRLVVLSHQLCIGVADGLGAFGTPVHEELLEMFFAIRISFVLEHSVFKSTLTSSATEMLGVVVEVEKPKVRASNDLLAHTALVPKQPLEVVLAIELVSTYVALFVVQVGSALGAGKVSIVEDVISETNERSGGDGLLAPRTHVARGAHVGEITMRAVVELCSDKS